MGSVVGRQYLVEVQYDSSRRDLIMGDVELRGALKLMNKQGMSRLRADSFQG